MVGVAGAWITAQAASQPATPSGQFAGLPCQSVPQPHQPELVGISWQVQSQQVMVPEPVTQQPPAYQVVLITQGLAQVEFARQFSQEQGVLFGNAQRVPAPADTGLARRAVPAAAPMSVPNATSAPRPTKPRRDVLRASPSLIFLKNDMFSPSRQL